MSEKASPLKTASFTVALCQMQVGNSVVENLKRASELISAASESAAVVMLPEMFCCPYSNADFVRNREPFGERITKTLAETAAKAGVILIGGSFPEEDNGKIYNTCPVFDGSGRLIAKHRKVHLFDIDIEGGQRFFESDTFSAGRDATVFDTPFGRFGVCICFDIRFPKLFERMTAEGARAVFVPAAFNMTMGPLHWELLFRARAVDNQVFMFGCAPARDTDADYVSYANSVAVDPWGRVLLNAGIDEAINIVSADIAETTRVRRQIPLGK